MTGAMERRWLVLFLVVAGSGLGCQETRFLSWRPRDPRAEVLSYEVDHDPFPDESMGPKTYSRPRAFDEPRTEEYKDFIWRQRRAAGVDTALATEPGMWDDTSPRYNVVR